jgi:hypothetical protein
LGEDEEECAMPVRNYDLPAGVKKITVITGAAAVKKLEEKPPEGYTLVRLNPPLGHVYVVAHVPWTASDED